MPSRLFQILLSALLLAVLWLFSLFLWGGLIPETLVSLPLLMTFLTFLYLHQGPVTGSLATILLGLNAEALSSMPPGRLLFTVIVSGLVILHVSRLERWSLIGRGMAMSCAGAMVWQGLLEFFLLAPEQIGQHWQTLVWHCSFIGMVTAVVWLVSAVLATGMIRVWKEIATRPVRFGSEFD